MLTCQYHIQNLIYYLFFYLLIHFDLDGTKADTLRREFKLYEDVFRFIIFKDEDAEFERRDRMKPVAFNIDAINERARFEKKFVEKESSTPKTSETIS